MYPILHTLIPVALACAVNGVIYGLGWAQRNDNTFKYIPPGYVIAGIWIALFSVLGFCLSLLWGIWIPYIALSSLLVFCILYPFLTGGLQEKRGKLLNVITLIFAFLVSWVCHTYNDSTVYYFIPLLIWVSYVNIVQSLQ